MNADGEKGTQRRERYARQGVGPESRQPGKSGAGGAGGRWWCITPGPLGPGDLQRRATDPPPHRNTETPAYAADCPCRGRGRVFETDFERWFFAFVRVSWRKFQVNFGRQGFSGVLPAELPQLPRILLSFDLCSLINCNP